jgi:hypothetical protein
MVRDMPQSACWETFDHTQAEQAEDERGPPCAHEGKRDPLGRQQPQHHAEVDEGLQHDGQGEPRRQVHAEIVRRQPGRANAAPQEQHEAGHHRRRADQAQFLADHREDEVAVGVGQVEELLPAFHEAGARHPAGAHRDQALDDVVAAAARVGIGIEERLDPVATVGRHHDRLVEHGQARHGQGGEIAQADAGHEQHHGADQGERRRRAQVGLDEDQEGEPAQQQEGGEQRRQELVDALAAPLEVVGQEQDDGHLGQLRGLEGEGAQADPAMGVVDRPQEQHQDQEQRGAHHHRVDHRRLAQLAVVEPHGGGHSHQAQHRPHDLAHQEVIGVAVRLAGQGRRRAPDHHQAQAHQGHADREEDGVGGELLSHCASSLRRRHHARPGGGPRP